MEDKVKKIFNKAKKDLEFQESLKKSGEKEHTPKWWWSELEEILYACVYMGYLVGKGLYKDSDY